MTIAFASSEGKLIDQHFGWSKKFYLYQVDEYTSKFINEIDSSDEPEEEKAKLEYKIGTIDDADIMYCTQIGPTASKMVQSAGIHPVRVQEGEVIAEAISNLQEMLNSGNPPMWLLRMFHKAKERGA
jgi:nitrogen fixation protein NifX